ncbi:CXADR-like membrane protein [Hypanus sabinus]|uniref:CXADR-like membrane protein n=1 Tax=Hypanus sabinus TaxID=79690 RepID=UPI0028C49200|nr:CXADR-like membrane protein [Hypanus sabinus]
MWTLILLIGFLPVSGALWAEKYVKGVVGRAITIDCHYGAKYRSHAKYWCHGWTNLCSVLVETKGQHGRSGRVSITDKSVQGIFTVTMKVLHSGDTGWYRCGITTRGSDPMFNVHLQVSNEPPSVPRLLFSPPTNGSSCVDSVSVSCKSVHGSLPIQYSWYEKTPSVDSNISDTNKLDLHCESLKYNHLYYCKASNAVGENSSKMVNVSISNSVSTCRYVIEVNGMGPIYICENTVTTTGSKDSTPNNMTIYIIVLSVIGSLLILLVICLLCCLKRRNGEWKHNTHHGGGNNETQEENIVYADIHHARNNETAAQSADNENGTVYANMKFKRKSRAGRSVMYEDNTTYADIKFQSQTTRPKQKSFSLGTPEDSE